MSNLAEHTWISACIRPPSAGVPWESLPLFTCTILPCKVDDVHAIGPLVVVLRGERSHS